MRWKGIGKGKVIDRSETARDPRSPGSGTRVGGVQPASVCLQRHTIGITVSQIETSIGLRFSP